MSSAAKFDELRSLGFGSISGTYATVGDPLSVRGRIVNIINNTEGDMLFTTDPSRDELFLAAGSFQLYDIQTNRKNENENEFVLPIGLQFYVKQLTAPVSGAVYIHIVHD